MLNFLNIVLGIALFTNYNYSGYDRVQEWKIIGTQILLTSNNEDKEALYKCCIGKKLYVHGDSIFFKGGGLFDQDIKGKLSNPKEMTIEQLDEYYDNNDRLSSIFSQNIVDSTCLIMTVLFQNRSGGNDSFDIVNISKDNIILYYTPYVLELSIVI